MYIVALVGYRGIIDFKIVMHYNKVKNAIGDEHYGRNNAEEIFVR